MIKIEVPAEPVEEFKGVSKKTGNPFHIRRQTVYVDVGDKYPAKTQVSLDDAQQPYAPGHYTFSPRSIRVSGEYGQLEFARRIELVPLPVTQARQAAS